MKRPKVTIKYDHDSADLNPIFLALMTGGRQKTKKWIPAYRDTVANERVVWVRKPPDVGIYSEIWILDQFGERKVTPADIRR